MLRRVENRIGVLVDLLAVFAQHLPPSGSLEEIRADRGLKLPDLRANAGLGKPKPLASRGDAPFVGDHPEVIEVVQIDIIYGYHLPSLLL